MTLSNPGNSNAESKLRTMPELLAMILPKPQHIFEHSGTFVNSMSSYRFQLLGNLSLDLFMKDFFTFTTFLFQLAVKKSLFPLFIAAKGKFIYSEEHKSPDPEESFEFIWKQRKK